MSNAVTRRAETLKREARHLFAKADLLKKQGRPNAAITLRIEAAKLMKQAVTMLNIYTKG